MLEAVMTIQTTKSRFTKREIIIIAIIVVFLIVVGVPWGRQ